MLLCAPSAARAEAPRIELPPLRFLPEGLEDGCEVQENLSFEPATCWLLPGTWIIPAALALELNEFLARAELYPDLARKVLEENDRIWRVVVRGMARIHHDERVVDQVAAEAVSSGDWRPWEVALLGIGIGLACLLAGTGLGALALAFG